MTKAMRSNKAIPGLIEMNEEGSVRGNPRGLFFNRKNGNTPSDWFRIENSSSDSTKVYIYDEIGYWGTTAQGFVDQLQRINTKNIDLHLNSPGGEVFDGVAIYNALKAHPATVTVYVDALAASAASFIAQAGDNIVMSRGSTMMIHDGLAFCIGNEKDMLDTANVLSKISNNIADIYAQRAGGTLEEWRALMREEVWYTAQEAVDANLADSVAESVDQAAVDATNKWDLSIFNHSGRSDAPSPDDVRSKIFTNRAKEAPVAQPATPRAEATENTPPAEGDQPAAPATTVVPEQPGTPSQPQEVTEPEPTPEPTPQNRVSGFFNINGVPTSDPVAVQAHITSLEAFASETRDENRRAFVKNLVDTKRVAASQRPALEAFALSIKDPEQYNAWAATFENAPELSIFGNHAEGTSNHGGDSELQANAAQDKINTLRAIVKQHKMSGMPDEKIKATASYNELVELDSTFKL